MNSETITAIVLIKLIIKMKILMFLHLIKNMSIASTITILDKRVQN